MKLVCMRIWNHHKTTNDDEIHKILLNKIAEPYIAVHGFSYASGWLEKIQALYKRVHAIREVSAERYMIVP